MKTLELSKTDLEQCVKEAGSSRVLVVSKGKPMALVSNVQGLDPEQVELGTSAEFWKLIEERRRQKSIPWADFKKRAAKHND